AAARRGGEVGDDIGFLDIHADHPVTLGFQLLGDGPAHTRGSSGDRIDTHPKSFPTTRPVPARRFRRSLSKLPSLSSALEAGARAAGFAGRVRTAGEPTRAT